MMRQEGTLCRHDLVTFIDQLYRSDLHAKRVLSLANATLGVLTSASLAVHAVGQGLAQAQGTLSKHGVKQVDRLLSNEGIVLDEFFSHWVPYTFGARVLVVVALDWTSFARDGHDTLVLSVLTSHGRSTPLMWRTVESSTLEGNRTRYEEGLLQRLHEFTPRGVKVTVVADRGFASCPLMELLKAQCGFDYVIRLRGNIYVADAKGERRTAAQWVRENGRTRTLRDAMVTDSHQLKVGTVVCVHDKEMKEPWCLVSSEREAAPRILVRYYAKRWGIETSFRDIKDMRFGMGLSAMRIKRVQRRDRMLLLSALTMALLVLLGAAGEKLGYDRWLKVNTVKYRTHSLFRQGLMLYQHIPGWPEERLRPLVETFAGMLMEQRMYRGIFGVI